MAAARSWRLAPASVKPALVQALTAPMPDPDATMRRAEGLGRRSGAAPATDAAASTTTARSMHSGGGALRAEGGARMPRHCRAAPAVVAVGSTTHSFVSAALLPASR
jgi:hypothetical protein